jgi:hypothetical protein
MLFRDHRSHTECVVTFEPPCSIGYAETREVGFAIDAVVHTHPNHARATLHVVAKVWFSMSALV